SGLKLLLSRAGIEAEISGREKHPYSIWKKMAERHISFEQLSDIMAFRAIVPTEEACYAALGVIHRRWPMVPGRFKDYISTPKRNGYR
ncbi:(p)ppGpp synthetase, partial [Staphylococcus aureus]